MKTQITCVGLHCSDEDCGYSYVFVGSQKVDARPIIARIEAGENNFWTLSQGEPVDVVVNHSSDGRRRLVAGAGSAASETAARP